MPNNHPKNDTPDKALVEALTRWRDNLKITQASPVAGDPLHGAGLDFVIEQLDSLLASNSPVVGEAHRCPNCHVRYERISGVDEYLSSLKPVPTDKDGQMPVEAPTTADRREAVARIIYANVHHLMRVTGQEAQNAYDAAAKRILSLIAVPDGWRTINSAPRDGTKIILFDANVATAAVGEWMADVEWRNKGKIPGQALAVPSWFPLASPTHWAPLPGMIAAATGEAS